MEIRPTRRGYGVAVIVGIATAMGYLFGTRSLDVLVASGLLAMGIGFLQLVRLERPTVERTLPSPDHVGTTDTVRIAIDPPSPLVVHIHDVVPDGVEATMPAPVALDELTTLAYEIDRIERGIHSVGPIQISAIDIFGLLSRTFEYDQTDELVVYPPIEAVDRPEWFAPIDAQFGVDSMNRDVFESIREYAPGDSLRDIHWPSSAKRSMDQPTFVVRTFMDESDRDTIVLAGESTTDGADRLAAVLAGLSIPLLEDGVPVGIVVADGAIEPDVGRTHRRSLLRLLARTNGGSLDDASATEAAVFVRVDGDHRVTIQSEDRFENGSKFDQSTTESTPSNPRVGGAPLEVGDR